MSYEVHKELTHTLLGPATTSLVRAFLVLHAVTFGACLDDAAPSHRSDRRPPTISHDTAQHSESDSHTLSLLQDELDVPPCSIEVQQRFRIGSADGNAAFGSIMDVDFDDAGNIYILDGLDNTIRIFTERGDYIRALGGRGIGPGQFTSAYRLAVGRRGLFVLDRTTLRLTHLTPAGKEITSTPLPHMTAAQPHLSVDDERGFVYLAAPPRDSAAAHKPIIYQFSFDLQMLRAFGSVKLAPTDWPYLASGWLESAQGKLIFAPMALYSFYLFDSTGRMLRSFDRPHRFRFTPRPFLVERATGDHTTIGFDLNRALTTGAGRDSAGRYWHFVRDIPNGVAVADVFAPDGRWLASGRWALDRAPGSMRKRTLFGISTRNGYPELVLFHFHLRPRSGQKGLSC